MVTRTKAPARPRCSKKALVAIIRSMPAGSSQKRSAMNVARIVKPASARAPSHRILPDTTMADAVSSNAMTTTAKTGAGERPKCSISAIAPPKSKILVSGPWM
jgi:hypothetical protein